MKKKNLLILTSTLFMVTACGNSSNNNQRNAVNVEEESEYTYFLDGYYYINEAMKTLRSVTYVSEKIENESTEEVLDLSSDSFDIARLSSYQSYGKEVIEETATFYDNEGIIVNKVSANFQVCDFYGEENNEQIEMVTASLPGDHNEDSFFINEYEYFLHGSSVSLENSLEFYDIPGQSTYEEAYNAYYNEAKLEVASYVANMITEPYVTKVKGNQIIIESSNGGNFDQDENPHYNSSLDEDARYLTYFNKKNNYTIIEKINDAYYLKEIGSSLESYLAMDYDGTILKEPRYLSSIKATVVLDYEDKGEFVAPKQLKPLIELEYAPFIWVMKKDINNFVTATGAYPYNVTDLYNEVYKDNPYEVYEFAINADANDAFILVNADESGASFTFTSKQIDDSKYEVVDNYHDGEHQIDGTQVILKETNIYYFNIFVDKQTHQVIKVSDGGYTSFIQPITTEPLPPM